MVPFRRIKPGNITRRAITLSLRLRKGTLFNFQWKILQCPKATTFRNTLEESASHFCLQQSQNHPKAEVTP